MLLIVSNSSAAFAQVMFASLSSLSYTDIAMFPSIISDLATISDILLYVSKSLWNHFFTFIISIPYLLQMF